MLNNIGLPGLIFLSPFIFSSVMGVYSLIKVPNFDHNFRFAGFWFRFLAALIDAVIITLIVLIPAFIIGLFIGYSMAGNASAYEIQATANVVGNLIGLPGAWLYHTAMESSAHQATFGKKILGLRVIDLNGERISFGKANGRYFAKFLSLLTLYVGFFMVGWTQKKQGLHDKLAGCLVVKNSSPVFSTESSISLPSRRIEPSLNMRNVESGGFEAEALRRFKAGEIDEETMLKLLGRRSR